MQGCGKRTTTLTVWDEPTVNFKTAWADRNETMDHLAMLAVLDYQGDLEQKSFTLELFFKQPDTYMLRGRGQFGVEGFRALLYGDSLTVLLNRQKRGYRGRADAYPDTRTQGMWSLLRRALPWIVGTASLAYEDEVRWQVLYAPVSENPERIEVTYESTRLELEYRRYRSEFPYWHLYRVVAQSDDSEVRMELRQQLFNTSLDSALFTLTLPPGTAPLTD
jgi:hypothetical protein